MRPSATVPVNDQMLACARDALAAFGVQEQQLLELARGALSWRYHDWSSTRKEKAGEAPLASLKA